VDIFSLGTNYRNALIAINRAYFIWIIHAICNKPWKIIAFQDVKWKKGIAWETNEKLKSRSEIDT